MSALQVQVEVQVEVQVKVQVESCGSPPINSTVHFMKSQAVIIQLIKVQGPVHNGGYDSDVRIYTIIHQKMWS